MAELVRGRQQVRQRPLGRDIDVGHLVGLKVRCVRAGHFIRGACDVIKRIGVEEAHGRLHLAAECVGRLMQVLHRLVGGKGGKLHRLGRLRVDGGQLRAHALDIALGLRRGVVAVIEHVIGIVGVAAVAQPPGKLAARLDELDVYFARLRAVGVVIRTEDLVIEVGRHGVFQQLRDGACAAVPLDRRVILQGDILRLQFGFLLQEGDGPGIGIHAVRVVGRKEVLAEILLLERAAQAAFGHGRVAVLHGLFHARRLVRAPGVLRLIVAVAQVAGVAQVGKLAHGVEEHIVVIGRVELVDDVGRSGLAAGRGCADGLERAAEAVDVRTDVFDVRLGRVFHAGLIRPLELAVRDRAVRIIRAGIFAARGGIEVKQGTAARQQQRQGQQQSKAALFHASPPSRMRRAMASSSG